MINLKALKNKKGITPVIATVILVMITILLTSMLWYWLQGMVSGLQDKDVATTYTESLKIVSISNATGTGYTTDSILVTYSNTGKTSINTTAYVQFYYNGIANSTATNGALAVGASNSTGLNGTAFTTGNAVSLVLKGQKVATCTVTSAGDTAGYQSC